MTLSRSDMVASTHSLTKAKRTLSRSVIVYIYWHLKNVIITLFSYSVCMGHIRLASIQYLGLISLTSILTKLRIKISVWTYILRNINEYFDTRYWYDEKLIKTLENIEKIFKNNIINNNRYFNRKWYIYI